MGGVAKNNNQEIASNIKKEKYIVDFNDEEGGDTYHDINLAEEEGVAGNNNQEIATIIKKKL